MLGPGAVSIVSRAFVNISFCWIPSGLSGSYGVRARVPGDRGLICTGWHPEVSGCCSDACRGTTVNLAVFYGLISSTVWLYYRNYVLVILWHYRRDYAAAMVTLTGSDGKMGMNCGSWDKWIYLSTFGLCNTRENYGKKPKIRGNAK